MIKSPYRVLVLLVEAFVMWLLVAPGLYGLLAVLDSVTSNDPVAPSTEAAMLLGALVVLYLTWRDRADKSYVQSHMARNGKLVNVDISRPFHEDELMEHETSVENSARWRPRSEVFDDRDVELSASLFGSSHVAHDPSIMTRRHSMPR